MVDRVITKDVGNLRGISTDNIFLRPSNVAEIATNLQRAPDASMQIRRGYQCQTAAIGGLGIGDFDDPNNNTINTATLNFDGLLYTKLTKQIFFYYDGQVTGTITNITNANPGEVTSPAHGLQTGAMITINNVDGMLNVNNTNFTITVVDANHFTIGIDTTAFPAYTTGGTWVITFTQFRYLTFTIFTDPRFLVTNPGWSVAPWSISPWGSPSGESITCNITVNRAAIIVGNQTGVNTVNVQFGHELATGDVIQFNQANGTLQQRNVLGTTATTISFDGTPVTVLDGAFINQFFDIPFRKGFDVLAPFLISQFIAIITDPVTGVFGLKVAINGDPSKPAAFLQIVEPIIIDSNSRYSMDYWYFALVNRTVAVTFPGSASLINQNSQEFENASMETFDDVLYIANGYDFPQKYDGQTVYRVGMPVGNRPVISDNTTAPILPFVAGNVYTYLVTYEQIDNLGHIVEGTGSPTLTHTVVAANAALNVLVLNIQPNTGWNTDGADATGGLATVYGPDINGFFYDAVPVTPGYTLKIGDNAFYIDLAIATTTAAEAVPVNTFAINAGHGIVTGDQIIFLDAGGVIRQRVVTSVTATTVTFLGPPATIGNAQAIQTNKVGKVFGDIAIVNGIQNNVNIINVDAGHSIVLGDTVTFTDLNGDTQSRTVTNVTGTTITISGIAISINNGILIQAINMAAGVVNIQRLNSVGATLGTGSPISNNLRINIYRTMQGVSLLQYLTTLPNNSDGTASQTFIDSVTDAELGFDYVVPIANPDPPPISKYLKVFGNQLLYGGGEVNNSDNSDNVFFSDGNHPEYVSAARNFFTLPSVDDDVTGIGVSGSTLVITKTQSLWAITGQLLTSQFQVSQIAPGTNIGCIAHATIQSVGSLLYFLHTNGVYAITENQLFPTDKYGNPIPISKDIDKLFRETPYLPQYRYVFKRAVAFNYTKDNQYLLFLPCEDIQSSIRTANLNSIILCYDYEGKNWFPWINMNAAGGMFVINDDLYFQERRFSGINGNTANLYKQHRFYRLVDHADHTSAQQVEWRSSWEDLGLPEVRKKFSKCMLLMDRLSDLYQFNAPQMFFSSYLNRIPNLQDTMSQVTTVDNIRNSSWGNSSWGWNFWSGYQDTFVRINLKQGTVAKSMQVGFTITGINMDILFAGVQLEVIPEYRKSFTR